MREETGFSKILFSFARRLRYTESRLDGLANPNIFQTWVIHLAFIPTGLYILTSLSVLLAPWNIYRPGELQNRVFLRGRDFFLTSIAFYKLLGFQFVHSEEINRISLPVLKNVADWSSHLLASMFLVCIFAVVFLICGIIVKTHFNSIRLASYALGSFPIFLLVLSLAFQLILVIFGSINFYVHRILILGMVALWAVMVALLPVRVLNPNASCLRLVVGLFCGWLIAVSAFCLSAEVIMCLCDGCRMGFH